MECPPSAAKELIERVRAIQGPKNISATDADKNMQITSQIFKGTPAHCIGREGLSKRFRER